MANLLGNPGFETSGTIPSYRQGSNADASGNWSFSGRAGLHANGSTFNGKGSSLIAPNGGTYAAFLNPSNAGLLGNGLADPDSIPMLKQTFNVSPAGSYTLSFYAAQQNTGNAAAQLLIRLRSQDGKDVRSFVVTPGTTYTQTSIPLGNLSAQLYTILFEGLSPPYVGTRGAVSYTGSSVSGMVFIDDTSIA